MTITATRRLQYAIGHRVYGHEGKCAHLHGHNFVFFLTAEAVANRIVGKAPDSIALLSKPNESYPLDSIGRVIDFGVLKEKFDPWFLEHWDHGVVFYEKDLEVEAALKCVPGQKGYRLPYNPTAENLARWILTVVGPLVLSGTGVELVSVKVYETENGIAEVRV